MFLCEWIGLLSDYHNNIEMLKSFNLDLSVGIRNLRRLILIFIPTVTVKHYILYKFTLIFSTFFISKIIIKNWKKAHPLSDCKALRRRGGYCMVQRAYTLLQCMRHYDLIHGPDFNSRHDVQESISKSSAKRNQKESVTSSRGNFGRQ